MMTIADDMILFPLSSVIVLKTENTWNILQRKTTVKEDFCFFVGIERDLTLHSFDVRPH